MVVDARYRHSQDSSQRKVRVNFRVKERDLSMKLLVALKDGFFLFFEL